MNKKALFLLLILTACQNANNLKNDCPSEKNLGEIPLKATPHHFIPSSFLENKKTAITFKNQAEEAITFQVYSGNSQMTMTLPFQCPNSKTDSTLTTFTKRPFMANYVAPSGFGFQIKLDVDHHKKTDASHHFIEKMMVSGFSTEQSPFPGFLAHFYVFIDEAGKTMNTITRAEMANGYDYSPFPSFIFHKSLQLNSQTFVNVYESDAVKNKTHKLCYALGEGIVGFKVGQSTYVISHSD